MTAVKCFTAKPKNTKLYCILKLVKTLAFTLLCAERSLPSQFFKLIVEDAVADPGGQFGAISPHKRLRRRLESRPFLVTIEAET